MKLFSRKPKTVPTITIDSIVVTYQPDHEWWTFSYREQEFTTISPHLKMPSQGQLDGMMDDLSQLRPEMLDRLAKGWKEHNRLAEDWNEYEDVKINDGES